MPLGYWCPVLHAHLPYVRHPEYPSFMEEDWYFEALTETYIPLVRVLDGLLADGVEYRLTMTLSPPLVAMMQDRLLTDRYLAHMDRLVRLVEREVERTRYVDRHYHDVAQFYRFELTDVRRVFREVYSADLLGAFRKHQATGKLEVITCGATHGFLPLMDPVPEAVRAQVHVAADHYGRTFGRAATGIWLPECGYYPGHEVYLREVGIRFSFLEAHGLLDAHPRPADGVHAPIVSPGGVVFFGRDMESSRQVWSAETGYPGDYDYREFYKDIGWELPVDYLGEVLPDGERKNTGIKYHRVTGRVDLAHKAPYVRDWALGKAASHAGNFLQNRQGQIGHLAHHTRRLPIVVSPYDAELFGHWWFEGPDFLNFLFRKLHFDQDVVKPVTPSEYLAAFGEDLDVCQPPMCTWGAKGYADVWLNASNDWIYPHLDMAAERMVDLARRFETPSPLERRALAQAARELLLAQASDWAFIMRTGTTVQYAKKRTRDHIARFDYLYRGLTGQVPLEEPIVADFEWRDNIFPDVEYRVYR